MEKVACKICFCTRDVQHANGLLYYIEERKKFSKSTVTLDVEVFKKPGMEFIQFTPLKG